MAEERSLAPLLLSLALALAIASLVLRTFTTGAGLELFSPGAQLLFDALSCGAAAILLVARALAGEPPLVSAGWRLPALGALALVIALASARAPDLDLAGRTASTWVALLLLALACRELGRDPRAARLLVAALLACVVTGAALGLHEALVQRPELRAELERGELEAVLGRTDASYRMALEERIRAIAATGPWLLPNLLASAICAALPLVALLAWRQRRSPLGVVPLVAFTVLVITLPLTKSKGAVVTLGVVGAALALLHPALAARRRTLAMALAGVALLGAIAGLAVYWAGPERAGIGLSLTVRLEYWEAGLGMFRDHPLLGVGLNQFREYYAAYKPLRAEETLHAHNAAVQVGAELGLVGLLTLAALLVAWAWEGACAALAPSEPGPDDAPAPLSNGALGASAAGGLLLALLLLAGFGDGPSAATPAALAAIAGLTAALTAGLTAALAKLGPETNRPLAAAALAGAAALLGDGLLDFGLHHPGTFALTFTLAALAPALARAPARPVGPAGARTAAAVAVGALSLALVGVSAHALGGELPREQARAARERAADLLAERAYAEAADALVEASERYAEASAAWPWHVRTELERGEALRQLAALLPPEEAAPVWAQATDVVRRATELDPRAHSAWYELALTLQGRGRAVEGAGDLEGALVAIDRAAALYPGHPGYQLEAAQLRVRLREALPPGDPRRAALRQQALERLRRAEEASATTRLIRRKLTPAQHDELRGLLERLGTG